MRLTTFNTLIEPPLPVCTCGVRARCSFFICERGGAISRFSAEPWIVEFRGFPREPIVVKFQGPRCGSTRPQAFIEAASRPPAVVDSSTALAFNEAGSRGWIDNQLSAALQGTRKR